MRRIILLLLLVFGLSYGKGLKPYMFQLKDENGKTVRLEELKGNVVYLVFWSKTCHTCMEELPQINKLYHKYKNKNVKFFGVIIDEKNPEKIKKIKKEWGFDFPVLIGNDTVKNKYRIIGTPITYILRKDLTIGKIIYGAYSIKKLDRYIKKFLEEK
ncbi:AhpC/TSA family protein [Persephonella hydrogeniphila]|uniref:AhpC/TSA family protein n=1 Tax=Persephonella hydrogeniphila TaxID=198703 RepID=A0A285NR23_9AQUI|nr:TlpA disulfide reductase family protein [Persephonella hydrogeniphila]SNZ10071.1 AhpC/TSA family protein [Persephonella hydrogeniphila]